MDKLKPCPFCGGEAELREGHCYMDETRLVVCKKCHARTMPVLINHPSFMANGLDESTRYTAEQAAAKAAEAWNRRVNDENACIQQLETDLEAVKRERDALFADIKQCNDCYFCKHYKESFYAERCRACAIDYQGKDFKPRFEWRGICPENTNDDRSCLNCKHQGPEGRGICMDCNFHYSKYEPLENTEVQDEIN